MKKLLLFLMLLPALCQAQNQSIRIDIGGYIGDVIKSAPISLLPADTSQVLSIKATRGALSSILTIPQPRLIRTGLKVVVQFDSAKSLDESSWYELSVGNQVRFKGQVTVSRTGSVSTDPAGVLLAGINSDVGVLKGQYAQLSGTKLDVSAYSNYSLTVANTLATLSNNIADNVGLISQKLAISDTVGFQRRAVGFGLYPNTDRSKLVGISSGATANDTDANLRARSSHTGVQSAITIIEDGTHRFATDAEKLAWNNKQAALVFDTTPTAGSANLPTSGGVKAALDLKANQSTTYTQAQVTTLLQGYYLPVTVATKAAAVMTATGLQPKIIKVLIDESDSNRTNNKYIYDGDNQPLGYPLF